MSKFDDSNGGCPQITAVKPDPGNHEEDFNLMRARARFMATQPGFVSIDLHRSKDGNHGVNCIQCAGLPLPSLATVPRKSGRALASWHRRSGPASTGPCRNGLNGLRSAWEFRA
jgi:hypothetical protein